MTLTIRLNNLFIRIGWAVLGSIICLIFANAIFSHFLVRNIADRRIAFTPVALNAAAKRLPYSSRIQFRLAEAELEAAASEPDKLDKAQEHALRSASLSPWNYKHWQLVALAKDVDGKVDEVARMLQVATRLAPNNSDLNWRLANFWLRQGNQPEAMKAFRLATRNRADLLAEAFDIVWQASGHDVAALDELVNEETTAKLTQAQFLAEQGQVEASINVFRNIDAQAKLRSQTAQTFISALIQANRGQEARELWLAVVGGDASSGNGIWNGGFEQSAPKDFGHFDWALKASNFARIGFDRSVAHSGTKSLKLFFAGRPDTKLENEIQQLVVLKAHTHYRLECYALAKNLTTSEGPRIALVGQKGVLAVSEVVSADSSSWQHLIVDLVAPPESVIAYIAITRIPKAEYDGPTKGIVWFDDFKLTEQ
ncbi:MAG TPA: hypothetical protein PLK30_14760 [Blastocatellia bacterium]|nr:hypothetical protein [Blastocatellia bacterium]